MWMTAISSDLPMHMHAQPIMHMFCMGPQQVLGLFPEYPIDRIFHKCLIGYGSHLWDLHLSREEGQLAPLSSIVPLLHRTKMWPCMCGSLFPFQLNGCTQSSHRRDAINVKARNILLSSCQTPAATYLPKNRRIQLPHSSLPQHHLESQYTH